MSDEVFNEPERAREKEAVLRVCSYAQQICTVEGPCPTVKIEPGLWDARAVELAALECEHAGAMLYTSEAQRAYIERERVRPATRDRKRARRIAAIRAAAKEAR